MYVKIVVMKHLWCDFFKWGGWGEGRGCERMNMAKITEMERIREKFLCILSLEKMRSVVMIEHLWCDFVASINVATEYSFSDFSSNLSCLSFILPL